MQKRGGWPHGKNGGALQGRRSDAAALSALVSDRGSCLRISTRFALVALAIFCAGCVVAPGQAAGHDDDDKTPLVVVGDFNRDGIADIAEIAATDDDHPGPRMLTMRLGRGDGTYRLAASTALAGSDPRTLVVGDFNGDGIPDVIVGDGDGTLTELLGDGKGNLALAGVVARVSSVASIAVGDFNRDGTLDLAVSDPLANTVTILLGSGNGAFRPAWTFHLPMQGKVYHLATADFNGDGVPDLAVTNDDEDTFEVMLGNGNGTFTYAPELSHVLDPNEHCTT
jgi:hypothetical protein